MRHCKTSRQTGITSTNTRMPGAKPPQIAALMAPSPSTSCRRHVANAATSAMRGTLVGNKPERMKLLAAAITNDNSLTGAM
jgi:hypothetical protein